MHVAIDDRAREAHLSHYCPGGLGVPVTSSDLAGLTDGPAGAEVRGEDADENRLRADGETCGRCGLLLVPGQDARRRATGELVHESCPPRPAPPDGGRR